ncbi:MAG TPA: NAD(P)-dependent alcohol dehydrogenase [Anaerolineales bacterium]|nr:NAD(P)-dependent alcohol dehydrogenase [Anaerolineales bacterium]
MKAIVYTEFGPPDVLRIEELPKPVPKEGEILVRVHATSVNFGDLIARNLRYISSREFYMPLPLLLPTRMYFGFTKPKINILGSEFSGEIEAVGRDVRRFREGDQVIGYLGQRMGAYAEYLCMPEDGLVARKPANMTFPEAAAVPYGAVMATSLLRAGRLLSGQRVLINGASGGIGSAAVQLARHLGAEVTGVCGAPRLDYVRSLGAYRVMDYAQEDPFQNGETYDLIFDILGKTSFSRCKNSLNPHGVYLLASFKTKPLLQMMWTKAAGSKKVICALASEKPENLAFVSELIEAGEFKSIIDRCFPLEEAAQAHRYAESGGRKGQVVLTV